MIVQIHANTVRLLGVMGANRPNDLPQVPVVRELPGLSSFSVQAQTSTPAQLAQLLDNDIKRWTDVIQKAGIPQQ